MSEPNALVRLTEISKSYEALDGGQPVRVLDSVSLDIHRSASLAIVGPSGSGKSTLLNIIGPLDRPTSGQITLEGQDLTKLDEIELASVRAQQLGFIFQAHHLLPHCTVLENVLVPTLATKEKSIRDGAETRGKRLLDRVGLASRASHRPGQLSGGERQRVAVVRALINRPKLLLADEPTGALDRASAQNLAHLLVELNQEEEVTLIVVTHALDLADRMSQVLELRDGKLASLKGGGLAP